MSTRPSTSTTQKSTALDTANPVKLALTPLNFKLMAVAGAIIVAGFLLMLGAPSTADEFNPEIFSTRRIAVGPTIALLGFIAMGVAIMWPARKDKSQPGTDAQ